MSGNCKTNRSERSERPPWEIPVSPPVNVWDLPYPFIMRWTDQVGKEVRFAASIEEDLLSNGLNALIDARLATRGFRSSVHYGGTPVDEETYSRLFLHVRDPYSRQDVFLPVWSSVEKILRVPAQVPNIYFYRCRKTRRTINDVAWTYPDKVRRLPDDKLWMQMKVGDWWPVALMVVAHAKNLNALPGQIMGLMSGIGDE